MVIHREHMMPDVRQRIVDAVMGREFISTARLAEVCAMTPQSIRRHVNALAEQGALRRVHGGISPAAAPKNLTYGNRAALNDQAKRTIAAAVARFIPPNASVFMGLGTTPAYAAAALSNHEGLRVFTNNLNVASALAHNPKIDIAIAGGTLRRHDRDIIGSEAASFFRRFKVDFAIFGVGGIDLDGVLLDFEIGEIDARAAMVEACKVPVLVADIGKFGRQAPVRGGHLKDIAHFFTDAAVPETYLGTVADSGVCLHVGDGSTGAAAQEGARCTD
jgi:DeoR family glycerol-3-phosphate regulon repressor